MSSWCGSCDRGTRTFFWATHQGAELDLLLVHGRKRYGIEIKRADAPAMTRSMHIALADLRLDGLAVIYPGPRRYRLAPNVVAMPAAELPAATWSSMQS
jgi:predicted AAA+ superfamily ATPase